MSDTADFRREVREWLLANCPESQRRPIVKQEQIWAGRRRSFYSEDARLWFERMRDRGWTAPECPREYGGGGLSAEQSRILRQEMKRLHCRPPLYDSGLWMLGPVLLEFGSEAQKAEHLPKIVRGEIRWCQGYSEPSAGSDLASLRTRAEDRGDHFLLNGSKIWTTTAHLSDWMFCLARTDPDAEKHAGISFLLLDMQSKGVRVSPIKLISGESEFCETFFDNVRVPKRNLVGGLHQGWKVAKALLAWERKLMSSMEDLVEHEERDLVSVAREYIGTDASGHLADSGFRDRISRHLMQERALKLTARRLHLQALAGVSDARTPQIMKYAGTTAQQRKDELLLALLGDRALGWEDETLDHSEQNDARNWAFNKALTIAGGTSEIQLNIIARRVLGLPER